MPGSRADDTVQYARHRHKADVRALYGMLRRFAITLTSTGFWQGFGALLLDQQTRETEAAEVFPGIGHYARPPIGANCEGIAGYVGSDAQNPVWLAVRDEDTRKAVAKQAAIQPDETLVYTSQAYLVIRKDGSIVVRFPGSTHELRLATQQDLNGLATFVRAQFGLDGAGSVGHTHAVAGSATTTTAVADSTPAGIDVGPYDGTGP